MMDVLETLGKSIQNVERLLDEEALEPDAERADWGEREHRLRHLFRVIEEDVDARVDEALASLDDDPEMRGPVRERVGAVLGAAAALAQAAGDDERARRFVARALEVAGEAEGASELREALGRLREDYLRASAVVPASLSLGRVRLQLANEAAGEVKRAWLAGAVSVLEPWVRTRALQPSGGEADSLVHSLLGGTLRRQVIEAVRRDPSLRALLERGRQAQTLAPQAAIGYQHELQWLRWTADGKGLAGLAARLSPTPIVPAMEGELRQAFARGERTDEWRASVCSKRLSASALCSTTGFWPSSPATPRRPASPRPCSTSPSSAPPSVSPLRSPPAKRESKRGSPSSSVAGPPRAGVKRA